MSDYRKDEIIYDEDWLRVDTPLEREYPAQSEEYSDPATDNRSVNKPARKRSFPALITIQLVLCIVVAFIVFMLKAMNCDIYHQFCDWYNEQMQYTLVSDETFENVDLSQYLPASFDEIG